MTLRQFHERYLRGDFRSKDIEAQTEAGWFDWFCETEELSERLEEIWKILKDIKSDYILDNYQVRFENQCPAGDEPLYDVVRFIPLDRSMRERLSFGISIDDKRSPCRYEVFAAIAYYEKMAEFDSIQEVVEYINGWADVPKELLFNEQGNEWHREIEKVTDQLLDEGMRIMKNLVDVLEDGKQKQPDKDSGT